MLVSSSCKLWRLCQNMLWGLVGAAFGEGFRGFQGVAGRSHLASSKEGAVSPGRSKLRTDVTCLWLSEEGHRLIRGGYKPVGRKLNPARA